MSLLPPAVGRRLLVIAHDIRTTSPAHPRIRALLEAAASRGWGSQLVTAFDPGDWVVDRVEGLEVIADPVLEAYLRVAGAGAPSNGAKPGALGRAAGSLRRLGGRVQSRLLFPDNEAVWSRRVRRWALRRRPDWEWVVTCARPESVGFVGEALAGRGVRWWFDFTDGWTHHGLRREAVEPGRRREREQRLERRWVAAAAGVSTVDPVLAEHLEELRPDGKALVYANGIARELQGLSPQTGPLGDPLRLVHLGRLRGSDRQRSLQPALELFRDRPVVLEFRGRFDGEDQAEFRWLRSEGVAVETREYVPRAELAEARAPWDGAFVVGSPQQMGSSSKLLDAIGLRLPVLALVSEASVAAGIVNRLGAGVVAPLGGALEGCWARFEQGVRARAFAVGDREIEGFWCSRLVEPLLDQLGAR